MYEQITKNEYDTLVETIIVENKNKFNFALQKIQKYLEDPSDNSNDSELCLLLETDNSFMQIKDILVAGINTHIDEVVEDGTNVVYCLDEYGLPIKMDEKLYNITIQGLQEEMIEDIEDLEDSTNIPLYDPNAKNLSKAPTNIYG